MAALPFFRKRKNKATDFHLEGRNLNWLEKVARAPHQEPWSVTILQYAWTAGPVSLLAAYAGYYFGYGGIMPIERALYFVGYSLVAIALGLSTKLMYNLTHVRKVNKDKNNLLSVIDRIPEIIYMTRDLAQSQMTEDARRINSAGILLRKLDLGPEWVAMAVEDITGNTQLARKAEQIEMFRRAGLYNRMHDIVRETNDETEQHCEQLKELHPRISEALRNRLTGVVARPRHGQSREALFIERILTASERDNEELMTLHDVEEILTLCFELICGREINWLKIEYTGRWDLAKALDRLEEERNDFRISRARVYSRLKALNIWMHNADVQNEIITGHGLSPQKLLASAIESLDLLSQQVRQARDLCRKTGKHLEALLEKKHHLEKAIQLYNEAHRAFLKQGRDTNRLKKALKQWQKLSAKYQQNPDENFKRSMVISEQTIELDDDTRMEIANRLEKYLQESELSRTNRQIHDMRTGSQPLTETRAREIAIEVATILDPYIELHDPQIQRAIESSQASSLAFIEPGMSAKTKAAMGEALASAVDKNLAANAEKLAQNLIRYYRVPLTERTINFLVKTYQADRERLQFTARFESPMSARYSLDNISPIEVPPAKNNWQIDLYNANKVVSQFSSSQMES
ncbi:hypothetical protein EOPP23_18480 [Endozoicomonas sp. OPT23]|uniref:hypothetical protein n=1 Tax=Endozoicomonas sp. OPT23 TaxID=2072845 RepID=UPI00129A0E2D|nr:hypothetical protein [Endozoicomonas sp. OPT23]MRI34966.1 hypothetical protein [Endozoicomonas sp. OPT23]